MFARGHLLVEQACSRPLDLGAIQFASFRIRRRPSSVPVVRRPSMANRPALIATDYVAQYADPIDVEAGAVVRVEHEDPQFPGWWWCCAPDGRCGWVPSTLLDPTPRPGTAARLRQDYSARELSVQQGEQVSILSEHAGWLFVRTATGVSGWIPANHVNLD